MATDTDFEQLSQRMPSTMGTAAIAGAIAAEDEAQARRPESDAADTTSRPSPAAAQAAPPAPPAPHDQAGGRHPPESEEPPEAA